MQVVSVDDIIVESLSKKSVALSVDEIIRQPIDVQIIKQGSVPEGYLTEEMTLSLQQVFVKGPESYVSNVEYIRGALSVANETTEIFKEVAVEPVDKKW